MTSPRLRFRDATPGDEDVIARAVRGIAEAEGLAHKVTATPADYARMMFGPGAALFGVIAEAAGETVGCVVWHAVFSTYAGKPGIYIEDVFVEAAYRGQGIGRALFAEMARRAGAGGYDRLQWSCKNDNLAAVDFYRRLGADTVTGFTTHLMSGDALTALAEH